MLALSPNACTTLVAGPVVCGAFTWIGNPNFLRSSSHEYESVLARIRDSKQIGEEEREVIFDQLIDQCNDTFIFSPDKEETEKGKDADEPANSADEESTLASESGTRMTDIIEEGGVVVWKAANFALSCASADVKTIDRVNILQASLQTMSLAAHSLAAALLHEEEKPSEKENASSRDRMKVRVYADGNKMPPFLNNETGIEGIPPILSQIYNEGGKVDEASGKQSVDDARVPWNDRARFSCEFVIKGDANVFSIAAGSVVAKVVRDRIMRRLAADNPGRDLHLHKGYPTPHHKQVRRLIKIRVYKDSDVDAVGSQDRHYEGLQIVISAST